MPAMAQGLHEHITTLAASLSRDMGFLYGGPAGHSGRQDGGHSARRGKLDQRRGSLRAAAYYFRYGGRSVRLARPAE